MQTAEELKKAAGRRWLVGISIAAVIAAVTAGGFAGIAWYLKGEADEQRDVANRATSETERHLLRADRVLYCTQMRSAQRELDVGNIVRAEELLDDARWDLRGWEHRHLSSLRPDAWDVYRPPVGSVGFSRDGTRIITRGGPTVSVWDAATGEEMRIIQDTHISATFSASGRQIVTRGFGGDAVVWDVATGNKIVECGADERYLGISPSGEWVVTGDGEGLVRVLEAGTGKETRVLKGHSAAVTSVSFDRDERLIATGSGDHTIKVWDATSGEETLTLEGHAGAVSSVTYSADGTQIASGGDDGTVRIWDATSGEKALTIEAHADAVWSVRFISGGRRIAGELGIKGDRAYGGGRFDVKVWDVTTGKETLSLLGPTDGGGHAVFSPEGHRIVAYDVLEESMRLLDTSSGEVVRTLDGHPGYITSVGFSRDGKRIASGGSHGSVIVWDSVTGQKILSGGLHRGEVIALHFSPDGKRIISGGSDGKVKLWNLATGPKTHKTTLGGLADTVKRMVSPSSDRIISITLMGDIYGGAVWHAVLRDAVSGQEVRYDSFGMRAACFGPHGTRFACGSVKGTVKLLDAATGREIRVFHGHKAPVEDVAFSGNGQLLVSGSSDKTVRVWSVSTGKELRSFRGHSKAVSCVGFSTDGGWVVSGGDDSTVRMWQVTGAEKVRELRGHTDAVTSVASSPDDRWIVSGGKDNTVRLWRVADRKEVLRLKGHSDDIMSVAFSPDGERLVSGSKDQTVKVWDVVTGLEVLSFGGHGGGVTASFSGPLGERLESSCIDETTKEWLADTVQETLILRGHLDGVECVDFSPNGKQIVSGGWDKAVRVWNAITGRESLTLFGHEERVVGVGFSADGTRIVSGSGEIGDDGLPSTIVVWDASSGQELPLGDADREMLRGRVNWETSDHRIAADEGPTRIIRDAGSDEALTLRGQGGSDTSDYRIVAAEGRRLIIRDAGSNEVLFSGTDGGYIFSPRFSPDGRRIVSGCSDGTVKVWLQAERSSPADLQNRNIPPTELSTGR